eukprot:10029495-Heterocapsa_arctica.AAC.1
MVLLRTFRFLLTPANMLLVDAQLAKTMSAEHKVGKKGRERKEKDADENAKARAEAMAMFGK